MRKTGPALLAWTVSFAIALRLEADVLDSEIIDAGLSYARYSEEGLIAHVLKMDLKTRSLHLRSVKARGKESIRQLVQRVNDQEMRVVAGINGDFFRQETSAGLPYGIQVSDGHLLFAPLKRSMILFTPANEPYIGTVSLSARINFLPKAKRPAAAKWPALDGVNVLEDEIVRRNGLYLYTPAFLGLNLSQLNGLIAVVEAIQPALQVGDVCEGSISRIETCDKPVTVPEAGCLLYFLGDTARQLAGGAKPGQSVALRIDLPPFTKKVDQAIGGGPRLVKDGKVSVEIAKESFNPMHAMEISKRHPRSAIGYDKTLQSLYLVMVEGRHDESRGMTFDELASFLAKLGCWQAMAFDGGGSAGLYVAGKGIVSRSMGGFNQPEEREVANGLLITSPRNPSSKKSPARGEPGKTAPKASPSGEPKSP